LEPARLPGCTAFVPVHDEVDSVAGVVDGLRAVLPRVAQAWEIVIVDDGSRDGTGAVVDRLAATRPAVRVVRHATNRGYGAAVRSGLASARHPWVFYVDGDGQFDAGVLQTLVDRRGDADAVVGHRVARADPWHRRVYTAGWNALVRRALGLAVRDVNCGCKLVRRTLITDFPARSDGGAISAELLAHLARRGARIVEVAVPHHPRRTGRASGGRPRVALRALADLALLWWSREP
jgi:glycosyltransferase involved in cell wall biosynthesis